MLCKSCGITIDSAVYEDGSGSSADCVFCGGEMRYTAYEWLSKPELGLVSEIRPTQLALTQLLEESVKDNKHAVVEAGTGVGKSFAYLLSSIINGKRVVISTAKKSLQSQLINKDLPLLQKLLGPELSFAPAYGKSNYGCLKESQKAPAKDKAAYKAFFANSETWLWEEAENAFDAHKRKNRSLPLYQLPNDHWKYSARECVGKECQYFKNNECEYLKARKQLSSAKVIVTNHWLLGYDIALRNGFTEDKIPIKLFGDYHVLIVDEAHKFEDGFRTAFTKTVKDNFITQVHRNYDSAAPLDAPTLPRSNEVSNAWDALFNRVDSLQSQWDDSTGISGNALGQEGQNLLVELKTAVAATTSEKFLRNFFGKLSAKMGEYLRGTDPDAEFPSIPASEYDYYYMVGKVVHSYRSVISLLEDAYKSSSEDNYITYIEKGDYRTPSTISVAPIDMGGFLQSTYEDKHSVVFISATLSINGSFGSFKHSVGLTSKKWADNVVEGVYGSAFNYKKQSILYLTNNVGAPTYAKDSRDAYRDSLAQEVQDLLTASKGNAFVLFTSRVEMDHVHDYLLRNGYTRSLLRQTPGMSAANLLQKFRTMQNPVLLGLKSFWEGVDVQGKQLELVIITKLPFPSRSEPVTKARRERAGKEWFRKVDEPDMILDLRQGAGRLIRSTTDRGVVAILDQRLLTKKYRHKVINSLNMGNPTTNKEAVLKALGNLAKQR